MDRPPDLPLRQLSRLRAEMGWASAQIVADLFPDQAKLGIEFGIVARICLADWISDGDIARPIRPERAISIRRIGQSLGASLETTRRHIRALSDLGVVVSSPAGVQLAASPENEVLVRSYYLRNHDLFVALAESVAETCDVDFTVDRSRSVGLKGVIERVLDMLLMPIDTFRPAGLSLAAFFLWSALTAAAVRSVTFDPVLSRRFANGIPPDELRAPISLQKLADAVAVPYATVWRNVQTLEKHNLVTRIGSDQWVVLTHNLLDAAVVDIGTLPSTLLYNKLRDLALAGFDVREAERHYRLGRLVLADLWLSRNG